jgi:hypothetical protein
MALIVPLAPEAQKEVLAASGAIAGLARNGQAEAIERLRQGWNWESPAPAGSPGPRLRRNHLRLPACAALIKLRVCLRLG